MVDVSRLRVKTKDLRWRCNPESLGFETTNDFECQPHIIGQDRALDAIRLGLEMKSPGYNIYIAGLHGTGKTTAIKRVLESMDLSTSSLQDTCYVHNFKHADSPVCVSLPAGRGIAFKKKIANVLTTIRGYIPAVMKSDRFKEKQTRILNDLKQRKNKITQEFEKEVQDKGFSLVEVEYAGFSRPEIAPVVAGEVVSMDQLSSLMVQGKIGRGDYDKMEANYPVLMEQLEEVLSQTRELQRELNDRMSDLEKEHILPMVRFTLKEVKTAFNYPKVPDYLEDLEKFIMDNLGLFHEPEHGGDDHQNRTLLPFEVNVIVDNSGLEKAPVIIETSPSYANLFGTIERITDSKGEVTTDFTAIRAGSLHRANGGYLVLNLNDLFEEPHVWPTFKRALKNKSHRIRGFDSFLMMPVTALKPDPVELDIKVVLIGDAYSYQILYEYDEDFGRIFKVKSEFDDVMPNRKANLVKYSHFIKNLCEAEGLTPFHKTGAATLIEEAVRLAGQQTKISTQFSEIGDLIRESSYWAQKEACEFVTDKHVDRAAAEKIRRASLHEDKLQEMYDNGLILLNIRGSKVGQVNGLAVFSLGDHSFGKPTRITAETGVGRAGVINVEREAEMSGRIHNKGMLILEGYLRRMYAQDKPITMSASICFEQAYSGIDGDSASSTEVYALLSSLSDVPLRQDIAVTGSVNQKGEIQPIGGVNEKIEGFFDVCKTKKFTGTQGVMIPALNKKELMLRKDVVAAIDAGQFHIYAVRTIDEGIEVLTGKAAGRRTRTGFSRESVHELADEGLRRYHEQLHDAENGSDKEDEKAST